MIVSKNHLFPPQLDLLQFALPSSGNRAKLKANLLAMVQPCTTVFCESNMLLCAVWMLFASALASDNAPAVSASFSKYGTVLGDITYQSDSKDLAQFDLSSEYFSSALETVGDLDGNGVPDIAVGDAMTWKAAGVVWLLRLGQDYNVIASSKITNGSSGIMHDIPKGSSFGSSLSLLGDLNGDSYPELAVGAPQDASGKVWLISLK